LCAALFLILWHNNYHSIDLLFLVLSETYLLQNAERKSKKGNPPPPRKKVAATTQPATADVVAPPPEIAATVAVRKVTKTSDDLLIESCLSTPPWKNHDDDNSTDSELDKERQEKNSPKRPATLAQLLDVPHHALPSTKNYL